MGSLLQILGALVFVASAFAVAAYLFASKGTIGSDTMSYGIVGSVAGLFMVYFGGRMKTGKKARQQAKIEERRHQEQLAAIQRSQNPPAERK